MTTPTRAQVVQWADECGLTKGQHWNRKNMTTAFMTDFTTLARADLEATIAEQADELKKLRTENELLKQVETNLCELHNVALAELESLRKDAERYRYIRLLHDDPDGEVGVCEYEENRDEWLFVTKDLGKYLDAAIAAAPKQE